MTENEQKAEFVTETVHDSLSKVTEKYPGLNELIASIKADRAKGEI